MAKTNFDTPDYNNQERSNKPKPVTIPASPVKMPKPAKHWPAGMGGKKNK